MGTHPLPKKEAEPTIFGPCLLWPNCWMHQDGTWHGGRPWFSPHCARHSSSPQKRGSGGRAPSHFRPIFIVARWLDASRLGTCESFFLRSNRILNRIDRPIRFRIEFSNRIGRIYSEYLIHSIGIYFVFVTNESDARNWVLVIHFNSVLKRVKLCRCTII